VGKYRFDLWKAMTKAGIGQQRGSNMALVDNALQAFWEARNTQRPAAEIADALLAVIKACNKWLKIKSGKSETRKIGFIKVKNELFAKRKAAVIGLADEAMKSFRWYILRINGQEKGNLRAKFQYQKQRNKTFTLHGGLRKQTKQLDSDYQLEREFWLGENKQRNISGTFVHEVYNQYHNGAYDHKYAQWDMEDEGQLQRINEFETIMSKNVHTLNGVDWVTIRQFAMDFGLDNNEYTTQCKYLRAEERIVALLFPNHNGLLENKDGVPVDTTWSLGNAVLYAMDKYGSLYAPYDDHVIGLGGRYLNHTTILAGNDVVCAGMIKVIQGQLTFISNNSGHYKPTIDNLRSCVEFLEEDDVDLSQTAIEARVPGEGGMRMKTWNAGRYRQFLGNFPPDVDEAIPNG
jgi:hypothetical protein